MPVNTSDDRRGVYNIEYFSGSQASIYIGDVLIDEITSFSYQVSQSKTPLYGYADHLFRDVSKGVVLVQGQFSINFKEAGYLWLILNRYKSLIKGGKTALDPSRSGIIDDRNIEAMEKIISGDKGLSRVQRNESLRNIAAFLANSELSASGAARASTAQASRDNQSLTDARLRGFASTQRAAGGMDEAENLLEAFEDRIWGEGQGHGTSDSQLETDRRVDEPSLNDFDIYVTFGDYNGSDIANHTVRKLTGVHVLSTSQQVVIDGQPIQEVYSFIARNVI